MNNLLMTWVAMTLGFTSPLARQMASDPSEALSSTFFRLGELYFRFLILLKQGRDQQINELTVYV